MATTDMSAFDTPGRGNGILDVFRYRYLLRLLILKGTSLRYRNSALGWLWSYVRPTVQFLVYYLIVGQVLGMHRSVPLFPIYLFSGIVLVNLFNEAFGQATRAIVDNKALVRKIYLPRELFPMAAVIGSFIHFLPQLVILLIVCVIAGWVPTFANLGLMLAALLLVTLFVTGLGMFFSAVNVRFRDAQNFVEIVRTIATWSAPVLYTWAMVYDLTRNIPWVYEVYMTSPLTVGVELFHHAFWEQLVPVNERLGWPPGFGWSVAVSIGVILLSLILGQFVFRRLERTFAQDL